VKDSVVDADTAAAVDGWGDSAHKPAVEGAGDHKEEEEGEEAAAENAGEGDDGGETAESVSAEPEEIQLTLDEYLKQREEAAKALEAKVGVIQPRKLENASLVGGIESKRTENSEVSATAKVEEADHAHAPQRH